MEPKFTKNFHEDVYSNHFNVLRKLGQWSLDSEDPIKNKLYVAYKGLIAAIGFYLTMSGLIDLYQCRHDFKKIVFNMCTTMLIGGIWFKNLHVQYHSRRLNRLRLNLFMDRWMQRTDPSTAKLDAQYTRILLYHKKVFYVAAYTLLPLWLITSLASLVWGPRHLPFAVWTPVNLYDNFEFACGFVYHSIGSAFVVAETIQADMAMFSLLIPIACQFDVLALKIQQIDDMYRDYGIKHKKDKNNVLLAYRAKTKLRECVKKQLTLMSYVKELETTYNKPMLIQIVCVMVLSIGNGLELMVVSMNFSVKLSYQIGYSLIVLGDMFMYCNLVDLLTEQTEKVIWSLYNISWYEMDVEVQKDLVLITIGAQIKQPLTAAKMFSLNRRTFLGLLKNVYSWLALFRQLVIKK